MEALLFTGCIALLIFALGDMAFVNRTVAATFAVLFPLALQVRTVSPAKLASKRVVRVTAGMA
jgi:hypothetical protein